MLKFFQNYPKILAVMSEKKDGQMRYLSLESESNRKIFFKKVGIDSEKVATAILCHGKKVAVVKNDRKLVFEKTDGLITKEKNIFLSVTVADCVPVLFFDSKREILGVVHAGWKSAVAGIVPITIEKMEKLGADVKNISVEIGPGIGKCHFEIGKDVLPKFKNYEKFVENKNERFFVDLKGIIKYQLEKAGVKKSKVKDFEICTFCDRKYFSARRDKNKNDVLAGVVAVGVKG